MQSKAATMSGWLLQYLSQLTVILLTSSVIASTSAAEESAVAVAMAPGGANASDSWQRLLFNQAKYDHRYANSRQQPPMPATPVQHRPRVTAGKGGGDSANAEAVPFEEQDYRLEDVLLRTGQMIELLGLSNYHPAYMKFERPSDSTLQFAAEDEDWNEEDKDLSRLPSLEQLLMVSTPKREHLRRKRHRNSGGGGGSNSRKSRRRQRRRQEEDKNNQLAFLRRPQRRRLRRYLLAATACRVAPGWRDLGKAFWPRWLRQGECVQPPGGSCSIPSGMQCQPASHRRLYVLRYLCAKHWHRSQCRWVRQSLPVLRSCECKCA